MQSIILVTKSRADKEIFLKRLYEQFLISPFDITTIHEDKSIGVEKIRETQKLLFLQPLKGSKKALIIEHAELLTIEAQNALLKILEEPPESTCIVLSTIDVQSLLPTILSRCRIIEKRENHQNKTQHTSTIDTHIEKYSLGKRLKIAQDLSKNKEEAFHWLEAMILLLRKNLIENYQNDSQTSLETLKRIKEFQYTYGLLKKTNINDRLLLENLLLT